MDVILFYFIIFKTVTFTNKNENPKIDGNIKVISLFFVELVIIKI